jgi:hypothetical protein
MSEVVGDLGWTERLGFEELRGFIERALRWAALLLPPVFDDRVISAPRLNMAILSG